MRIEAVDRKLGLEEGWGVELVDGGHQGEGKWRQGWGLLGSMTLELELVDCMTQEDGGLLRDLLVATFQTGQGWETRCDLGGSGRGPGTCFQDFQVRGRFAPCQGGVPRSQGGTPTSEYEGQAPAEVQVRHDGGRCYKLEGNSSGDKKLEEDLDEGGLAGEPLHRSAPGRWQVCANCLLDDLTCAGQSDLLSQEDHQQD